MEEADELCDRVAIIDHGKILVEDTPAALKAGRRAEGLRARPQQSRRHGGADGAVEAMQGVRSVESMPGGVRVFADNADGLLPEIVEASSPYGLRDLTITESSLETVFIRLTGRDLRE
jgi:ABC-2 type transport system ATP-binding protein